MAGDSGPRTILRVVASFLHSQGPCIPWISISSVVQLCSCPWSLGDISNPYLLSFFFWNKPALSGFCATQKKLEENFVYILPTLVCLCLWCFYLEQICSFNLNKVKSLISFIVFAVVFILQITIFVPQDDRNIHLYFCFVLFSFIIFSAFFSSGSYVVLFFYSKISN